MAEWLILLLLVPAVVVPVVLLVGFAGCDQLFGIGRFDEATPVIDSAVGKGVSRITLTWTYGDPVQRFEFNRLNPNHTSFSFDAPASPFDDTGRLLGDIEGLQPETSYTYQVAAVLNDGSMTKWSGFVTGTTLGFQTVFDETLPFEDSTSGHDLGGWEGFTIVQRIEPAALTPLSPMERVVDQVRITLRASNASDASIDRIFISRESQTPGANPYDSDADHVEVPLPTKPFVIAKGMSSTLVVDYTNVQPAKSQGPTDPGRPLLIAAQFSPSPSTSAIRYEDGVPPSKSTAWWKKVAEADGTSRSATYTSEARIYLIEKVEVG